MEEQKDRILEVALCVETFIILVLICIVVHYITQSMYSPYDVNKDGKISITDVSIVYNEYMNS